MVLHDPARSPISGRGRSASPRLWGQLLNLCSPHLSLAVFLFSTGRSSFSSFSLSPSGTHSSLRHTLDYSPPGSSVHGILQARILQWPSPLPGASQLGGRPCISCVSCVAGGFLPAELSGKAHLLRDLFEPEGRFLEDSRG